MAQQRPSIEFEDVPLEQARAMGRGPRMDPELYGVLKEKIGSLANTATRIILPEGTRPDAMKNRIRRIASELKIPVTIRRVPGGLIFWRSTEEDLTQDEEPAPRPQPARQPPPTTRPARRRRA